MSTKLFNIIDSIYQSLRGHTILTGGSYNQEKIDIIIFTLLKNIVLVTILVFLALLIYKKKSTLYPKLMVILAFTDLLVFSKGNLIAIPLKVVTADNAVTRWLTEQSGEFRFFSTSGNLAYTGLGVYWTHLRAREPFSPNKLQNSELADFQRLQQELAALPENQGLKYGLADVSGYAAAIPASYQYYWEEKPTSPNSISINNLIEEQLNISGVKFIITGYPDDYLKNYLGNDYSIVFEKDGIKVYQNNNAYPRAFLVSGRIVIPTEIISYLPNKVQINTKNRDETVDLILTDNYYPGWEAFINGKKVKIEKYKNTFRMVRIPSGEQQIEFKFQPLSLKTGARISILTVITLSFNFLWEKRKR